MLVFLADVRQSHILCLIHQAVNVHLHVRSEVLFSGSLIEVKAVTVYLLSTALACPNTPCGYLG